MKSIFITLVSLLFTATAHAQWQTTEFKLKGGWNSIYLAGDASYATIEEIFPDSGVTANIKEIWRWKPNPSQVQFTTSPSSPIVSPDEWDTWTRDTSIPDDFTSLNGQTACLVYCAGTTANTYNVSVKHSPKLPSTQWVRNGANFLGFPSRLSSSTYPFFSKYFATFPAAFVGNAKIYKYVGGPLGDNNPLQILSPSQEPLDATQAYWFSAEVVNNFYAPVDISLSEADGLDFGRNGSIITMRVLNRSLTTPMKLKFAPKASKDAPVGVDSIAGSVPLTLRTFNKSTATWEENLIGGDGHTVDIGKGAAVELNFGIDRNAMMLASSPEGNFYGSFLQLTDASNLFDILVPVRARTTSLAGLWVGEALVKAVESKPEGDAITSTARSHPLRYIIHVSEDGSTSVLSQVFLGKLTNKNKGLCTYESGLLATDKESARRIAAAHMPLNRVLHADGTFAIYNELSCTIRLPFDDPTNPFVHQFHPDHDNKNAQGGTLIAGQESYEVTRDIKFKFTPAPPAGSTVTSGWGSSVIGGNYSEVIQGLHKDSTGIGTGDGLRLSGTFELRRVSEIGSIHTQ